MGAVWLPPHKGQLERQDSAMAGIHPKATQRQLELLRIAQHVVDHGHKYQRSVYDDGSPESGPSSATYRGFRLGKVKVEMQPQGGIYLWYQQHDWRHNYGGGWFVIIGAYIGHNEGIHKDFRLRRFVREFHHKLMGYHHWCSPDFMADMDIYANRVRQMEYAHV
jgi:hypothetical protein